MDELTKQIHEIRADRQSGALDLTAAGVAVLQRALAAGRVLEAGRQLCRAQPAMAPLWNAALHAVASRENPAQFEVYANRVARAPAALARVAVDLFAADDARAEPPRAGPHAPLHIVTFSASGSVLRVLDALAARRTVQIALSDARPGLEGRRAAVHLAERGIGVTFYTDAALGAALEAADAVLLGADAVGPAGFINKCGSGLLAAAAGVRHAPVYLAATRDKLAMPALWPLLGAPDHPPDEVWPDPPSGIRVRNPYFEAVPLDLVAGVVTDMGVLAPDLVVQACEALQDDRLLAALGELVPGGRARL